jgi:photosystem II stability/assembly factor-like uncharacterized protein
LSHLTAFFRRLLRERVLFRRFLLLVSGCVATIKLDAEPVRQAAARLLTTWRMVMNARKTLSALVIIVLSSGLWLAGCGQPAEPSPGAENTTNASQDPDVDESNDDVTGPDAATGRDAGRAPDVGPAPDVDPPRNGSAVDLGDAWQNQWQGPEGPSGGTYTQLWAAAGSYFAVQVHLQGHAQLWRSRSGETWTEVALPSEMSASEISTIVAHKGALFLIAHEVYRSSDDGQTWQSHQWQGLNAGVTLARVFADELYVVTAEPQQSSRLYRIAEDQAELIDDELPERPTDFIVRGQTMLVTQGTYAGRIFVKDSDQDAWTLADTPPVAALGGTKLHLHEDLFYATSEAGVWRSAQGQSFSELVAQPASQAVILGDRLLFGLLEPWNYLMSIDISQTPQSGAGLSYLGGLDDVQGFQLATDGESLVGAMHHRGLVRMDFNDQKWKQISPSLRPVADSARTADHRWLLTPQGKLFGSADGETWQMQPIGEHLAEQLFAHDEAIFMVTKAGEFVALRRHQDRWSLGEPVHLSDGTAADLIGYDDVLLVPFAPTILSGRGGSTAIGGGLFLAENSAAHWTDWNKIDRALPEEYAHRQTPPVYAAHAEAGLLVVVAEDGIYHSGDAGQSWQKSSLDQPFDDSYLGSGRAWLTRSEDTLFAGTITGEGLHLRRSDDDGESWSTIAHSLDPSITATALDARGSTLLLGTWKEGLLGSTDAGQSWQSVGQGFPGGAIYDVHLYESSLEASTSAGMMRLSF